MASSVKKTPFKSAKGTAMYPWLNNPDTQFDAAGQYKVNLRMSKEEAQPLIDAVKEAANEAFGPKANSAKLPFKTDEETGDTIVVTKSKFQPKFVDSTGQAIKTNNLPEIYGGSTLKVGGQMFPYNAGGSIGVSLQLGAVQLIELSESSNGANISFEAEDGGFVATNDNGSTAAAAGTEDGYNF